MRDSEMRQAFASLDRRSQEKMLLSMHSGKHQELADALLRAHPRASFRSLFWFARTLAFRLSCQKLSPTGSASGDFWQNAL